MKINGQFSTCVSRLRVSHGRHGENILADAGNLAAFQNDFQRGNDEFVHPDYAALDDTTHPRHMETNRKYNRLVGLS